MSETNYNPGQLFQAAPAAGQPMPQFDPFKGFREEVSNIDTRKKQAQDKSLKMASMIEAADSSTMFGRDYDYAKQWAQNLTESIDDFSGSTEGMIQFAQATQQLQNFIKGREAYKTENFGSAKDGAGKGTFLSQTQSTIAGVNPWEKDGFEDERDTQYYETQYMQLNQPVDIGGFENGMPVGLDVYNQSIPQAPFMPKLRQSEFEGGFNWFEKNAKGRAFPDGKSDAMDWATAKMENDENLKRRIVRDWKVKSGDQTDIDELLTDEKFLQNAKKEFLSGVEQSFNSHSSVPKDETKNLAERFGEVVVGEYAPADLPSGVSGSGNEAGPPLTFGLTAATPAVPEVELGFDSMYELKKPLKTLSLGVGENASIVGFNVDPYGQVHVTVKKPTVESGVTSEEDLLTGNPDTPKFQYETIIASENVLSALRSEGIDDEMIGELMAKSQKVSKLQEASQENFADGGMVSEAEAPKRSFIGSVLDRFSSGRFRRE